MIKRAFAPRAENLEGRRLCAVESTPGAIENYVDALGDSIAVVAQYTDDAIEAVIHYPRPDADLNPGAPTAPDDPPSQAGLDAIDAGLANLYQSPDGGPLPMYAIPYGDYVEGFGNGGLPSDYYNPSEP